MSVKKVYICNICSDEKKTEELIGFNFSTTKKFKLDNARSTDGTHICNECLLQIKEQLSYIKEVLQC